MSLPKHRQKVKRMARIKGIFEFLEQNTLQTVAQKEKHSPKQVFVENGDPKVRIDR
jgi:hypothetical protein